MSKYKVKTKVGTRAFEEHWIECPHCGYRILTPKKLIPIKVKFEYEQIMDKHILQKHTCTHENIGFTIETTCEKIARLCNTCELELEQLDLNRLSTKEVNRLGYLLYRNLKELFEPYSYDF